MPKFATQTLIQNRCIALAPALDCDVIHRQATLRHHLLQVAVAQRIAQVPSDAKYYDHVLEVSSDEQRRPVLHHRITYQNHRRRFATDPYQVSVSSTKIGRYFRAAPVIASPFSARPGNREWVERAA